MAVLAFDGRFATFGVSVDLVSAVVLGFVFWLPRSFDSIPSEDDPARRPDISGEFAPGLISGATWFGTAALAPTSHGS